jgi:Rhamnan synthesis protein F
MDRPEPERSAASLDADLSGTPGRAREIEAPESANEPAEAARRDIELARLYARLARLQFEVDFYRQERRRLIRSVSWRLTRPLRLLNAFLRKCVSAVNRNGSRDPGDPLIADLLRAGAPASEGGDLRILHQHAADLATLRDDPTFDPALFLPVEWTRTGAIVAFLTGWVAHQNKLPDWDRVLRRPCPGFHPHIYAHAHAGAYDTTLINPLAHFIRSGRPEGPWRHDVITPASPLGSPEERSVPSAALHAHFHYPELAQDLFRRIAVRGPRCDLLVSTDHADKAAKLRDAASAYRRGEVRICVVPNRGRDIGAFLTGFADDIVARYQIIGHVHGKRSLHAGGADPFFGERWREFLWQNLIGDQHPMMDIVLARLARDEKLGIVFPDDPYLNDWDGNRATAEALATRIGMTEPLPPHFDFPVGTMFWARTAALKPLFDLKLAWDDYPREPAANDGTILNAVERLLPFAARHAGYRFATTHVPGVTR